MLEPGTQIAGYRVEEFLAAGGMGAVYRATQLSLERVIALKVISDGLSHDPAFRARFRREAVLQAALEHPHIVSVYEAGESEHGLFIAMRFLPGASLEELAPRLQRARTLELLEGVASALDAAHAAGLVHRDVKPHNILIAEDVAYLADFGLTTAVGLSSMTSAGQFIGTVDYVSPEQIRDEEPDARSDIYAFGAVLYRCMTGSVPFPRSTKVAVIYAQLEQDPPAASAVAPELPAAIDPVLARALAKDPAARYATASELIHAAQAALAGHPSGELAPPAGSSEATTRLKSTTTASSSRPKRRGVPAAALALAVALVAALAGVAGYVVRHGASSGPSLGQTRPLTAGQIAVQVPAGWTARRVALPELFGPKVVTALAGPAGEPGATLAIGLSRGFGPGMLPTSLQAISGSLAATAQRVVTRNGLQGLQYSFDGGGEAARHVPARRYEILFVPTGHLNGTVACVAPGPAPALFNACRRVMATVTDPAKLPLDPRNRYATFLSHVFTKLSRAESTGLAGLRDATGHAAQATDAASIAGAFSKAQAALQRFISHGLSAPEVGLHFALRSELGAIAADYRALASAAATANPAAYMAAAAQTKRDRGAIAAQIFELTREGYALTS